MLYCCDDMAYLVGFAIACVRPIHGMRIFATKNPASRNVETFPLPGEMSLLTKKLVLRSTPENLPILTLRMERSLLSGGLRQGVLELRRVLVLQEPTSSNQQPQACPHPTVPAAGGRRQVFAKYTPPNKHG